jgi:hypothetical protein
MEEQEETIEKLLISHGGLEFTFWVGRNLKDEAERTITRWNTRDIR